MKHAEIDEKGIIREAIHAYLEETAPDQIATFDLGYDGMYAVASVEAATNTSASEGGVGLTAEQLGDATIIAAALWTAKSLFWFIVDPILEDKVLAKLDKIEALLSQKLRNPRMCHRIRELLERAIRKRLAKRSDKTG